VRLIAVRQGGVIASILKQDNSSGELVEHSGTLSIPDDNKTIIVVLGLDAVGTAGKAIFDDIYLGTSPRAQTTQEKSPALIDTNASIRIDASKTIRKIPESLYGTNLVWIWDGEGLWDDKKNALNEDIVRLAQELRPTLLRFPGGTFADFYHWRDGIGPRSKRPATMHLPEGPTSKHNIGTDEVLKFADLTGSQLMITVNIATGTPEEAVEWLRYVNRPEETKGQPPKVKLWEIGNENYYYGDAPYVKQAAFNSEQYAQRFLSFARALKAADPRISIAAIVEENFYPDFEPVHPDWTRILLSRAAHLIDYLAIHNGYVPGLEQDRGEDVRRVYGAMLAAPGLLGKSLDRVSSQVREHAPKHADRIKLAVTEWAPSFQIVLDGRYLDHPKTLGSALFVASNLKNYIEHPDMEVANFFKLNGMLWQNMIGLRDDRFVAKAPYYAFQMYRQHFGTVLVDTQADSPTYDSPGAGYVPALRDVPYLDAVSSLSEDGDRLYIMVVNKHFDQSITARIEIAGFEPRSEGLAYVLSGTGIDANTGTQLFKAPGVKWARQAVDEQNARFYKGGPGEISITEHPVTLTGSALEYSFGKHSVTAIELVRVDPRSGRRK
jgi:alpha-N-arabinofuranosidase